MAKPSKRPSSQPDRIGFREGFDPRKLRQLCAFQLGYTSYLIPCGGGPEELVHHIYQLRASLDELAELLNASVLLLVVRLLDEIEECFNNNAPPPIPPVRLMLLGSRLLPARSKWRPWYELGASIGSYVRKIVFLESTTEQLSQIAFQDIVHVVVGSFLERDVPPVQRFWNEFKAWYEEFGDDLDHVAFMKRVIADGAKDPELEKAGQRLRNRTRDVQVLRDLMERWYEQICAAIHPEGDAPYWWLEAVEVIANRRPACKDPVLAELKRIGRRVTIQPPSTLSRPDRLMERKKITRRAARQHKEMTYAELAEIVRGDPKFQGLDIKVTKDTVRNDLNGQRGN